MKNTREVMKFPVSIDPATGKFETVTGTERVRQSVMLILKTGRGERHYKPAFGSDIYDYPFGEINRTELNLMERDIRSCLLRWEPELEDILVSAEKDMGDGVIYVTVAYRLGGETDEITIPLDGRGD